MQIRKATPDDVKQIKCLWKEMMEFHIKHKTN